MASLEEILGKLLVADNAIIQQGTQELREAFKNPDIIPALCNIVVNSPNPQIRQYAAVLLRKRLMKGKAWNKLQPEIQKGVKQCTLQALVAEPERFVKNAIAQLIGTLIRHEFPNQSWPELLQFIQQMTGSDNVANKELGMYTLSIITEISPDQFLVYVESFAVLFYNTLVSVQDPASNLAYYTIITMIHFLPLSEGNTSFQNLYFKLMPNIMAIIKALVVKDEEKACEAMEIFDEMIECAISVITPHLKAIIEMCLEIGRDASLGDCVRVKAIHFVGWITRIKKKAIVKNKLVEPILDVLFGLMCMPCNNDDSEEYFSDDSEGNTPTQCATQTLDVLALHLPPDKLIPPLLHHVQPALQGQNLYAKKASYIALAVLAEGCAESLRTQYMESLLQCICEGIINPSNLVRHAALFALGQFSEHLQPEISKYAPELLPVLFQYLEQLCNQLQKDGKEPPGVDRMFYALEMFCENLGEDILPYLPTLMERLFTALDPKNSIHLRELALSGIGSTANAAKESMLPYFSRIIESLKLYLSIDQPEETMCLQVQALDTLGALARTLGEEHFKPLANESINLGLQLIQKKDDPDLRKSAYGLFASVSTVMKENMNPLLPDVVDYLLLSIKSVEGIVPHFKDGDNPAFPVYEDVSDTPEEEDIENESVEDEEEDEDVAGYSVENAFIEEKEEACLALREIAANVGEAFLPYLENAFEEVFKLVNYPQEDIRKAALDALTQFCVNFSKINTPEGKESLQRALSVLIPKLAEIIRTDPERGVVMSALDAFTELLKEIKGPVLEREGHKEAVLNCIKDVMQNKTECQDTDEEGESEDRESEQDELLIECAGDIVPNLGKAMNPDDFSTYFKVLFPLFASRTKLQCSVAERSFSIGTLSDSMEPLGHRVSEYVPQLLPLFLQVAKDSNEEVRNNAIFGLGELAFYGKEALFQHYPQILGTLSAAVAKEQHPSTLDNICGAIARLILTNISGVPMEQVFPVFVKYLPLREDFAENKAVFQCISYLYQLGHPLLQKELQHIIRAAVTVLNTDQIDKDTQDIVLHLIKSSRNDFPQDFASIVNQLPPELAGKIQNAFS